MSVPDAAALAKAKDKGLFESHIEEKSVSVSLAVPIHEILCSLCPTQSANQPSSSRVRICKSAADSAKMFDP